jgi:DNA-binding transcriptional ArsR family regulator
VNPSGVEFSSEACASASLDRIRPPSLWFPSSRLSKCPPKPLLIKGLNWLYQIKRCRLKSDSSFNQPVKCILIVSLSPTILNVMVNNRDRISAVFAALADPTRRRILARLSKSGERPVTALAKPFQISLPAISRHLRVLKEARLIDMRREGRAHMIRARAEGLKSAQQWIARCTAAGWDFSFDALDRLLETDPERGKQHEIRGQNHG